MIRAQTTATPGARGATGPYCEWRDLLDLRRAAASLRLSPPSRAINQLSGPNKSNFRGRGIEFEEVRSYEPGDDVRAIDWRVTARTGKTHTKLFREERERPVYLLVDQRSPMFFGSWQTLKSVQAVHAAALLAWATLERGDRLGGLVMGDAGHQDIRPRRSRGTVMHLLRLCHDYNHQLGHFAETSAAIQPPRLEQAIASMRRVVRPGSLVFLLSDFSDWDAEAQRQLLLLARHVELAAVSLFDPLERELPLAGRCKVSDGSVTREIDTGVLPFRERYSASFQDQQDALRATLRRIGAPFIELSTQQPALQVLSRFYRTRKGQR